MNATVIAAILRHLLTTVGGVLVARGTIDAATAEAVVGALATLAGVGWSLLDKRKAAG